MRIVIAALKSWNLENAAAFKQRYMDIHEIKIAAGREELSPDMLREFKPDFIFFPHWSYVIPEEIYESYTCIVFHMTDLPYGRGGSPLQNLIVRGFRRTKVCAIRVQKGFDTGPVYLKKEAGLEGSAEEIFRRISKLGFEEMIPDILEHDIEPMEQTGEPVVFKRRRPEESELCAQQKPEQIYDVIRMLDAEGYPKAFLRWGGYKLVFSQACFDGEKVRAAVEMIREDE